MRSVQEKRASVRFVNPAAAAEHYRWHRAFYMAEARRCSTKHGRERAVLCARVTNISLVSALLQVRDGAATLNCGGVGRKLVPPAQEGQR